MMTTISVIIPVYNSEKYLKRCVDSLLSQDFQDVEFIFVDDGSTDNSRDILENYRKKDNRISILSQPNENAGVARNKGIDAAQGKYLVFLDSDDFFKPNLLSVAYHAAEAKQAQIVIFEYYSYVENSGKIEKRRIGRFPKGIFALQDLGKDAFQICKPMPWNKMFLRDFILDNQIRFQSIKRCNDKVFVCTALSKADRLFHLPKRLLYYRYNNPNSLQGAKDKSREDFVFSLIALKNELINRNLFNSNIVHAYNYYAANEIKSGMRPPFSVQTLERYYRCIKQNIMPNLFYHTEDFCDDAVLKYIYESSSFADFLVDEYQRKCMESVSKDSIEYKIGEIFMKIPRKLF